MIRKLTVLVGAFALALGAWAYDYTYTFKLDIDNIPDDYKKLGSDATYYLVNTKTKEIYMYVNASDWHKSGVDLTSGSIAMGTEASVDRTASSESVYIGGVKYETTLAHLIDGGGSTINNVAGTESGKQVQFINQFKSDLAETTFATHYDETLKANVADTLAIIMDDPLSGTYGAYYQEFSPVTYDYPSHTFYASGSFINNVPEPTSGVLLLVGLAGLALRRRKAA